MAQKRLSDISLYELSVFLEISKTQSIRETARRFDVEAGQISRLMRRLETKVGSRLIERTPTGVSLTQQGSTAVKVADSILERAGELSTLSKDGGDERTRIYGIGSTSFLSARVISHVIGDLSRRDPTLRTRLIDIPPRQIVAYGLKGAFEIAIHIGSLDWPRSWQVQELGEIRWQLFSRKGLGLGQRTQLKNVKEYPFILPVYWTNEGLMEGDDQCPLKASQRKTGIATATAETALEVLKSSDQLAFLPEILARKSVEYGEIVPIHVKEWKTVAKKVYLSVRSDVVPNRMFEKLGQGLARAL